MFRAELRSCGAGSWDGLSRVIDHEQVPTAVSPVCPTIHNFPFVSLQKSVTLGIFVRSEVTFRTFPFAIR